MSWNSTPKHENIEIAINTIFYSFDISELLKCDPRTDRVTKSRACAVQICWGKKLSDVLNWLFRNQCESKAPLKRGNIVNYNYSWNNKAQANSMMTMAHLQTAIWLDLDPVFSNFLPHVSVIMSCCPSLHLRSVGSAYCGPFSSVQTIVQWVRHTSPPAIQLSTGLAKFCSAQRRPFSRWKCFHN